MFDLVVDVFTDEVLVTDAPDPLSFTATTAEAGTRNVTTPQSTSQRYSQLDACYP